MSEYLICGRKLKSCQVWFEPFRDVKTGDYAVFHGVEKPEKRRNIIAVDSQRTLITDLSRDEQEIFSDFSATVKNEIRRCEKDNVRFEIFTSDMILKNASVIKEFSDLYEGMYRQKGLDRSLNSKELAAYAEKGDLIVSAAYIDENPVIFHSYIVNGENSRFLHSCSEFRSEDKSIRSLIGRENKYLHWMDMQYLKCSGVRYYDWGGVFSFDEPNGIDKFKLSFGGGQCEYYNVTVVRTLKAKFAFAIKRLLKKQIWRKRKNNST